jgi:hypothetical protein
MQHEENEKQAREINALRALLREVRDWFTCGDDPDAPSAIEMAHEIRAALGDGK